MTCQCLCCDRILNDIEMTVRCGICLEMVCLSCVELTKGIYWCVDCRSDEW